MDCKCTYCKRNYWFGGVVISMADGLAWLDSWTNRALSLLIRDFLRFMPSCYVLSVRRSGYWLKELYSCESCLEYYWWISSQVMRVHSIFQSCWSRNWIHHCNFY